MKKYFEEELSKKISLSEYWLKIDKEYQEVVEELKKYSTGDFATSDELQLQELLQIKKIKLSKPHTRIKHIHSSLGDVQIREDVIETLLETFDSYECRYGTICYKPETIQAIYQFSEAFPELSKEALGLIHREYIKDIFDKYSLIQTLAVMLCKDGMEDSTFEKFMIMVSEYADKAAKKYSEVAGYIRIFCKEYSYDFVRHFERFVQEHHISWERFCECLPSAELIMKDQLELKALASRAKDCWGMCDPISFQMLEDYLDGDTELSYFDEQPYYYISTHSGKVLTPFTKQEFLDSIQKAKVKKLEKK